MAKKALLLRNSERQTFKRCRRQWRWAYVDRLKPKAEAPALRFGDLIHRSLADYYVPGTKRGDHPALTFERLYEEQLDEAATFGFRDEDDSWHSAAEMGVAMLEGYVDEFEEAESVYSVICSERPFRAPVRVGGQKVYVVGTIDGVWRDRSTKKILFKEFKTARTIALDGLPLDEQAGTYWTYGPAALRREKILKPSDEPVGVLYTFLRKALPDPRPRNPFGQYLNQPTVEEIASALRERGIEPGRAKKDDLVSRAEIAGIDVGQLGSVSKVQPSPLFHRELVHRDEPERTRMHARVLAEIEDMLYVREDLDVRAYKNPGPLHAPNCRFCAFRDMCELEEVGADWEAMRDGTMVAWDPYDAHEERN